MDIGDIFGAFGGWLSSGLFWLVMAILLTIGVVSLLVIQKRRKLKYNCLELISFGNGKVGINYIRAGIFKKKSMIFGLWDYGVENFYKTNDGRVILEATSDDLQDINGKKGFILRRKDDDPKILVPISKVEFDKLGESALFSIAPADFRDASVNIVNEATKETQGWMEKYLPYIMLAGMVIFFIVGFILASQFFNRTVDKSAELLTTVAKSVGNTAPGVSP